MWRRCGAVCVHLQLHTVSLRLQALLAAVAPLVSSKIATLLNLTLRSAQSKPGMDSKLQKCLEMEPNEKNMDDRRGIENHRPTFLNVSDGHRRISEETTLSLSLSTLLVFYLLLLMTPHLHTRQSKAGVVTIHSIIHRFWTTNRANQYIYGQNYTQLTAKGWSSIKNVFHQALKTLFTDDMRLKNGHKRYWEGVHNFIWGWTTPGPFSDGS